MKKKRVYINPIYHVHDDLGLECDVLLTSIVYNRIDVSWAELNLLDARIKYLKKILLSPPKET